MKRPGRDAMEEGPQLESDASSELSEHSDSSDSDDDRRKAAGSAPRPAATVPPLARTEAQPAEAVEPEPVPEILDTAPHGRRPRRSPPSPVARNAEPQDNCSVPSPAASSPRGRSKSVTMEVDEEANLGQGRKSTRGREKPSKSSEPVEIEDRAVGASGGRGHQKVARHQYARLSSALHTAEEKPDYDPNTVTGSPASPRGVLRERRHGERASIARLCALLMKSPEIIGLQTVFDSSRGKPVAAYQSPSRVRKGEAEGEQCFGGQGCRE
ncbi:hypothetical protein DFJ74DRAFT_472180 [Hyaloraphidium curvatum]|nr:hypothetical protein DFJ74DRAFT_472180 [Hyaloraphidium curvatum]